MKRGASAFWLCAAALLGLLLSGCVSKSQLKPGFTHFGSPLVIVPAQIVGNHFIVETKWDKHGPWRFIIDTGSGVPLVSAEFAKHYGSADSPNEPAVHTQSQDGHTLLLPPVTIRRLDLGEVRFSNVRSLIYDLSELSAHLGMKIDGVLGFSLFHDTVFTLDYPGSRLVLTPIGQAPASPGVTIHFNNEEGIPLIPVRLGNESFIALVDSGSDAPLMLNPVGLNPRFKLEPRPGAVVGNLTGNRTQEIGRLAGSLGLGAYTLEEPIADLTDQLSALGGQILRNFSVTFDPAHNQVTLFRPSTAPVSPEALRHSGLSFSKKIAYWRVEGVIPGSPADAAGVRVGDLVTRINGESVSAWNLQRFDALVRRATDITFTFLDGSRETPMVIPTFELVP